MTFNNTQQEELASFYNTCELIKGLRDVIKHIFRLSRLPVSSEFSDLRNLWLRTMCACTE